jgi:hypothetical protein
MLGWDRLRLVVIVVLVEQAAPWAPEEPSAGLIVDRHTVEVSVVPVVPVATPVAADKPLSTPPPKPHCQILPAPGRAASPHTAARSRGPRRAADWVGLLVGGGSYQHPSHQVPVRLLGLLVTADEEVARHVCAPGSERLKEPLQSRVLPRCLVGEQVLSQREDERCEVLSGANGVHIDRIHRGSLSLSHAERQLRAGVCPRWST